MSDVSASRNSPGGSRPHGNALSVLLDLLDALAGVFIALFWRWL